MRFLSIFFLLSSIAFMTSACQSDSESPESKNIAAPEKTSINNSGSTEHDSGSSIIKSEEKNLANVKEESQKSMEHAETMEHVKEEAHKSMEHAETMEHVKEKAHKSIGKNVYDRVCSACHNEGIAGAIKLSDRSAWREHIHHGIDHMIESVIKGKGAMPARGGEPNLSDEEIEAAVNYIIEQNQ